MPATQRQKSKAGGRPRHDDRVWVDRILLGVWLWGSDLSTSIKSAADRLVELSKTAAAQGVGHATITASSARRRLTKAVAAELTASGCEPLPEAGRFTTYLQYVLVHRGFDEWRVLITTALTVCLMPVAHLRGVAARQQSFDQECASECFDSANVYIRERLTSIIEEAIRTAETP
jgi:hypothetical protein